MYLNQPYGTAPMHNVSLVWVCSTLTLSQCYCNRFILFAALLSNEQTEDAGKRLYTHIHAIKQQMVEKCFYGYE